MRPRTYCELPGCGTVIGMAALLLALAATAHPAPHMTTAAAFRDCAHHALRGDFGKLAPWQREGYQRGLHHFALKRGLMTCYFPEEGFPRGQSCFSGVGVNERVASSNRLEQRSFVWIANPTMIRQVLDTGDGDRIADRFGCELWVDIWIPHLGWHGLQDDCYVRNVVCIAASDR